jgi:hypothetical protein
MKNALPAATFAAVFALHAVYVLFLRAPGCGPAPTLAGYLADGDVFLGLAYALGVAFALWSLGRFLACRSAAAAAGTAGGTLFVAGLAGAACFFTGCCGSPMLVVYAGLFGVSSLAIPKWSIALLALLSTVGGWWWQTRRPRSKCGCDSGGPEVT